MKYRDFKLKEEKKVSVSGWGTISVSRAKKEIDASLKELTDHAKRGNYRAVKSLMDKGIIENLAQVLIDIEEE